MQGNQRQNHRSKKDPESSIKQFCGFMHSALVGDEDNFIKVFFFLLQKIPYAPCYFMHKGIYLAKSGLRFSRLPTCTFRVRKTWHNFPTFVKAIKNKSHVYVKHSIWVRHCGLIPFIHNETTNTWVHLFQILINLWKCHQFRYPQINTIFLISFLLHVSTSKNFAVFLFFALISGSFLQRKDSNEFQTMPFQKEKTAPYG